MRVRVRSTVRTCTPHASMHSAGKENVPKEDDDNGRGGPAPARRQR
jgi:hypothetical protein